MVLLGLEKVRDSIMAFQSCLLIGTASTIYAIAGELGLEVYSLSLASSMYAFFSLALPLDSKILSGWMIPFFSGLSSLFPKILFC